jgi:hypothetical protein
MVATEVVVEAVLEALMALVISPTARWRGTSELLVQAVRAGPEVRE